MGELTERAKAANSGRSLGGGLRRPGGDRSRDRIVHRAIDERDIFMPEIFFDPLLDPLRSSSRYPEVLAGMGLTR